MNKVILVIIDGLRCDVAFKEMRYMVRLTREGLAARFTLKAEMPSLSKPLYETLLTGIPPYLSGVTSNEFKGRSTQKSIFHLTKEKRAHQRGSGLLLDQRALQLLSLRSAASPRTGEGRYANSIREVLL